MRIAQWLVVCLIVGTPVVGAHAADATWYGTTDAQWVVDTNWSTISVPGTGDIATFDNAGNTNTTIDLGSGVTVKTLLFDAASAAAYTIGSGAVNSQSLTLDNGGAITVNAAVANNQLVNTALTLGDATAGSYTFTNDSTNSLTVAGTIAAGTSGTPVAKTLRVTGAGDTTLNGVISDDGLLGASLMFVKSDATGGGLGKVFLTGANTFSGGSILGNGTNNSSRSNTATANSGGFVMLGHNDALGTGTITMKGAQVRATVAGLTISNNITIEGGGFRFGGANGLTEDLAFSGNILLVGTTRGIGNYSGDKTLTLSGNIDTAGIGLTFEANDGNASNGTIVVDGIISGGGSVTVQDNYDNGFVYLNNAGNSFTGKTIIKGGTLVVTAIGNAGFNSPLGTNGTIDLYAGNGATLRYAGTGETTDKVINLASGTSNATIEANNPSGLLKFTSDITSSASSKTFRLRGTGVAEFAGVIKNNSATNKTSLLKIDEGVWILSGDNTFTGNAKLGDGAPANTSTTDTATSGSDGFVIVAHNNALGAGTVVVQGAQLRAATSGLKVPNAFTLDSGSFRFGGANDLELSGALTIGSGGDLGIYTTNKLTLSGSLAVPSGKNASFRGDPGVAGNVLISGPVTGDGGVILNADFNSGGTVTLSGANTYGGDTAVNAGTLVLANSLALQNTKLTTGGIVFDAAVVPHAFTFGALSGSGAIALEDNAGTPNAVALSVGNSNANSTYSGIFSGSGSLTKVGTGKLTLSGANVHNGGTSIQNGTLAVNGDDALGATGGAVLIANNAALQATASFTSSRNLTLGAGGGTIDTNGNIVTLSGAIDDGGNNYVLTKAGAGTLVLAGTINYGTTGAGVSTAVDAGVLSFSSLSPIPGWNQAGRYTVAAGAVLAVDGSYTDGEALSMLGTGNFASGAMLGFDTTAAARLVGSDLTLNNGTGVARAGTNDLTLIGNIAINAAGSTIGGAPGVGGNTYVNGLLSGTNGVMIGGGGTTQLSADNSFTLSGTVVLTGNTSFTNAAAFGPGLLQIGATPGAAQVALTPSGNGVPMTLGNNVELRTTRFVVDGSTVGGILPASTLTLAGNVLLNQSPARGGDITLQQGLPVIISGNVSGSSGLTTQGTGVLVLTGANNYFYGTSLTGGVYGVLSVASAAALPGYNISGGPGAGSTTATGGVAVGNYQTLAVGNAFTDGEIAALMANAQFAAGARFGFDTGIGDITTPAGPRTYGGVVADTAGGALDLRAIGNDTLTLTAANTYTGATVVGDDLNYSANSNKLALSGSGTISNAPVTVRVGALDVGTTTQTITTLKLGGGFAGTTSAVTIDSGGFLNLGGNVTYESANNNGGSVISGLGTLNLGGNRSITVGNSTATASDLTIDAVIADGSAVSSLTKLGLGTLTLNGANTFSGGAVLGTGTTNNSTTDTASASSGGFVVLGNSAALGTGTITVKGAQFRAAVPGLVITNPVSVDSGAFRFGGGNDLTFTGAMTYVPSGNREFGNYSGTQTLTLGSIDMNGAYNLTFKGVEGGPNGTTIVNGEITGGGNVVVGTDYDNGIVQLNHANTYTGNTTVNTGTLVVGDKAALSAGTLTMADGSILEAGVAGLTGVDAVPNALVLTGGATVGGANALELSGSVTSSGNDRTLTLSGGDKTLSGDLVYGGNGLRITTGVPGTTTLSGANKTIRRLDVDGGASSIVDIGAANLALVNGGGSTLQSATGGTIDATGGGAIVLDVGTGTDYGNIGTADGTTLTIDAKITGGSFESWVGAGNTGLMVLTNAANDFMNFRLNSGTVSVAAIGNQIDPSSPLGQATILDLAASNNATLRYTGTGETTDKMINLHTGADTATIEAENTAGVLKFTGNMFNGTATSKIFQLSGSGMGEFAGAIQDNSPTNKTSVTKSGSGTWKLTGAYTYTGDTVVNDGTLEVGSLNSPASTTVGGILIADSIVQDTLTINAGGSVIIRETVVVAGEANNLSQVPEPSTLVLSIAGAAGLLGFAWRRRTRAAA